MVTIKAEWTDHDTQAMVRVTVESDHLDEPDILHFANFLTGIDGWTVSRVAEHIEYHLGYVATLWAKHPEQREAFIAELERMRIVYRLIGPQGVLDGQVQG